MIRGQKMHTEGDSNMEFLQIEVGSLVGGCRTRLQEAESIDRCIASAGPKKKIEYSCIGCGEELVWLVVCLVSIGACCNGRQVALAPLVWLFFPFFSCTALLVALVPLVPLVPLVFNYWSEFQFGYNFSLAAPELTLCAWPIQCNHTIRFYLRLRRTA